MDVKFSYVLVNDSVRLRQTKSFHKHVYVSSTDLFRGRNVSRETVERDPKRC